MKYQRGILRKAANGFFAVIGFLTVLALTLGGIVISVGLEKQGKTFASLFTFEPQTKEIYTGERPPLPNLEKISENQKAAAQPAPPRELTSGNGTAKPAMPVAYSVPPARASKSDEYGVCPTCKHFHDLNKSCADDAAFVKSTVVKKEPTKATTGKKQGGQPKQTHPTVTAKPAATTPATVSWTAADNTPRAGRTVGANKFGNINDVTDLQREAMLNVKAEKSLQQLKDATAVARGGN